jgi:hypothetical protein
VQSSRVCVEVGEGHGGMGGILHWWGSDGGVVWACGRGSSAGAMGNAGTGTDQDERLRLYNGGTDA